MATVKLVDMTEARVLADRLRMGGLGELLAPLPAELALVTYADACADLITTSTANCKLIEMLLNSTKIQLDERQRKLLRDHYAASSAAIVNAGATL